MASAVGISTLTRTFATICIRCRSSKRVPFHLSHWTKSVGPCANAQTAVHTLTHHGIFIPLAHRILVA
jgi:hypothetical protein